jgi:uncharacterized peroxidase-related enzyme
MPFIKTISPADATGDVRTMYERQQSAWGYVPNYAKVFSHRPEVLARWGRLLAEIRRPMDARRFELVTFVAAHAMRNTACALAHGRALKEFLDDADILALANGEEVSSLTAAESAMVRFARMVANDACRITAGDVGVLRSHGFSEGEIFDIAATAAGRVFFTKLLDSLGVEADAGFLHMDEELRGPLTVGRPIDFREPELLPASQ